MQHPRVEPPPEIPVSLWGQFRRHLPRYGFGLLMLASYQYSQYWFDTRLMLGINEALDGHRATAVKLGLLLIGVALGAVVVRVASRVVMFNGGRIAEYELRRALLDRLHQLGPSFYRRMSAGEIMSRATNDLLQVRLLLGFAVLNFINTVFGLASALTVMLTISPRLTFAALATLPPLAIVTLWFGRQMFSRTRDNQAAIGQMSERVQSSIAGVRIVRSFGLEERELADFEKVNQRYLETSLSLARLRGLMGPIMGTVIAAGWLVVFWYGGHLVLEAELSKGGFVAFYRALGRLTWPLIAVGFLVSLLQRGRAAYSRLLEIFAARPDITDGALPVPAQVAGKLEVRNLTFGYGDVAVLRDVSFTLEAGASLAIVGRTGSGKSTLAVLLPRLQPTPSRSVFLDGHDICELPLSVVRQSIGYAQQSPFLFSTTAGRNIGYALEDPDAAPNLLTIQEAAERARILDELLALPDGLDTVVGERGVQLSGGQKQRIALARAFVMDPKVLILDDPLSAVDARTERGILRSIEQQRSRSGLILITHRVAAAARCDRIIVLDAGRIIEEGTHEELLRQGGLYAAFAEEQRIESELEKLGGGPPREVVEEATA